MACRKKLLFDAGWRFLLGDIYRKPTSNYMETYHAASAESGRGGAASAYDDSSWKIVDLPHELNMEIKPEDGSICRENGWYRNYFQIDEADKGKRLSLLFDGAGTECIVWVNGVELKRTFASGASFEVDFTDVACYGAETNVVSVYIDNTNMKEQDEISGLYRPVWLLMRDLLSIETNGVWIRPEKTSDESWDVQIDVCLSNRHYADQKGRIVCSIYDAQGGTVGIAQQNFDVLQRDAVYVQGHILMNGPQLWSAGQGALYTLHVDVYDENGLVDAEDTVFGFRTAAFDAENGLLLNDRKLTAGSIYLENGGMASAGELEGRVRYLLEQGCCVIKAVGLPPAPQLLEICDRLGMTVIEETIKLDSAPEGLRQMHDQILRDRNHPCVMMWSVMQETDDLEMDYAARSMNHLLAEARKLDVSRPVTEAGNIDFLLGGNVTVLTADAIKCAPVCKEPAEEPLRVKSEENLFIAAWKSSGVYDEITDPARMLDQSPEGWSTFYTSDCMAVHCIMTDGCVGFYTESIVPDFGPEKQAMLVFEFMENPFILRIEADGLEPFEKEQHPEGKYTFILPESYVPGTKVRIRTGMSPRMGRDQLTIRRNVRWMPVDKKERGTDHEYKQA